MTAVRTPLRVKRGGAYRGVVSAFCASLVGVGLARFAYTPLLPAIVEAHWFPASTAAYLGAANLSGYLIGALAGRPLAGRASVARTIRVAMLVATASFPACAFPLGFAWFFGWRFASGIAGGVLMVLAAPTVLPHLPASRRGLAGGLIFMGVGAGVAASGTLVPLLLQGGVRQAWLGLGLVALALTGVGWAGWPGDADEAAAHAPPHRPPPLALFALYAEYGLNAAGWVPHMIFLVDFVARGLGQGVAVGAGYWVVFGIGATVGPLVAGHVADRVGFKATLRSAFLIEAVAVLVPAFGLARPWLIASSFVVGGFVTGTVPLVLGRIHELLPHGPPRQRAAWSTATVGFALCQACAAYALSYVFALSGGDYALLFSIGAGAMVVAFAIDLGAGAVDRPRDPRGVSDGKTAP